MAGNPISDSQISVGIPRYLETFNPETYEDLLPKHSASGSIRPKLLAEQASDSVTTLATRLDKCQAITWGAESEISGIDQEEEDLIGAHIPVLKLEGNAYLQSYVKKHLSDFELRLQTFLHEVAEDMALEVEREQQHLLLMQNQVDKQGQMLSRELAALHKKVDGEVARRCFVASSVRESKEELADQLDRQERNVAFLTSRVLELEASIFLRAWRGMAKLFGLEDCFAYPRPPKEGLHVHTYIQETG